MTDAARTEALLDDRYPGSCSVCGRAGTFTRNHRSLREGYACTGCRSSLRYRGQAEALIELFGDGLATSLSQLVRARGFRSLRIFEPGVSGPFRPYLSSLPGYVQSFYWPDVPAGQERDGVPCQNLEGLTYDDDAFDLVITSDIMEHVRRPWVAFEELRRVLKPGGHHVFSIPVQKPMRRHSIDRVDTRGNEDVHLHEPRYHGDGAGGRSLVYIDYGLDIVERLTNMGWLVTVLSPSDDNDEARRLITFVTTRRSSPA